MKHLVPMGDFSAFYDRVLDEAPEGSTIVEVGVYLGGSLKQLMVEGRKKNLCVVGVDWGHGIAQEHYAFTVDETLENLEKNGVFGYGPLIVWDSAKAAGLFRNGSVYCVFIDACHEYLSVRGDIAAWAPKIQRGGILCGHDYDHPEVRRAVDEIFGPSQSRINTQCWAVHRKLLGWRHE